MSEVYCKAVLEPGTGLGNRLFPWARCLLFARRHGARMIAPIWTRPAVGQLRRGGVDYPSYLRQLVLFRLFQAGAGNLSPWTGFLRTRGAQLVEMDEYADPQGPAAAMSDTNAKVLLTFKGLGRFFEQLNGSEERLLSELRAITRDRYLRLAEGFGDPRVGICVRCGNDYSEASNQNYAPLGRAEKTPLNWYVATLRLIRQEARSPVPAWVVSDGTAAALRPLLEMENVTFVRPGAAISDLLVLSRARVLLAPGASSFAAWAAFFGQMPSATHPGQPLSKFGLQAGRGQFIGEFDPSNPSAEFLRQATESLTHAKQSR